jgi:hypothetical protein
MTWARVSSVAIAVAVALILIVHLPAIVMDPLVTAFSQVRKNTASNSTPFVPIPSLETTMDVETSVKKAE